MGGSRSGVAGPEATKMYLAATTVPEAKEALEYLIECEKGVDFAGWSPQKTLAEYRRYYGLEPPA